MEGKVLKDDLISHLQNQLSIARNEIKNLRQQVVNLKHTHKHDMEEIQNVLKQIKCENCKMTSEKREKCNCEFPNFQSIGTIESWFSEKRGIPRQGMLCKETQGILTLFPSVVNNPSYALDGLDEFSHLWIIYHFHKTDSNHVRTKVAPPKLNGAKVGVFSTRSPHRPCPIGLSVVKIQKIVENKIYFSGVDMLNNTPVLDIKPYIPGYDNPNLIGQNNEREVEGGLSDEEPVSVIPATKVDNEAECREAPDGEEDSIRIPSWIANSSNVKLKVEFTRRGLSQLNEMSQSHQLKSAIIKIVEEDPRSVYLKQKLGNQFYTFLIKDVHVTCKFDDANGVVIIYQMSLIPLLYRDWWDDFERPTRLFDQNFGLGLHRDDLITSLFSHPLRRTGYLRPWSNLSRQTSGSSTVQSDKDKFQVILDVQQFAPSEIVVKTQNNVVVVEGKHEEKQDEHGFISRHFVRKYVLPPDTEPMEITSSLSSDGVLTISAPKKSTPAIAGERVVPINQTGMPAVRAGTGATQDVSTPTTEQPATPTK